MCARLQNDPCSHVNICTILPTHAKYATSRLTAMFRLDSILSLTWSKCYLTCGCSMANILHSEAWTKAFGASGAAAAVDGRERREQQGPSKVRAVDLGGAMGEFEKMVNLAMQLGVISSQRDWVRGALTVRAFPLSTAGQCFQSLGAGHQQYPAK